MFLFVILCLSAGVFAQKDYDVRVVQFDPEDPGNPHPALRQAVMKSSKANVPVSNADSAMSIGTLFVYSYINSHLDQNDQSYTEYLFLTISNPSSKLATVNVTSVFPGFNNTIVTVPPNTSQVVSITPVSIQVDYMDAQNNNGTNAFRDTNKAIWVQSDQPIKLVATNQMSNGKGEDKFTVLPVCQLGTTYMAVVDESARAGSAQATNVITIIATQNSTRVLYFGSGLMILNKGEAYTIVTTRPHSGIPISTNKPVAVITGAVCGYGYYNQPQIHCSHEALMLYPTNDFEQNYPFAKFLPEDYAELMVYAWNDNTTISFDGSPVRIIDSNEFLIVAAYRGLYIQGNQPIYVVATGTINSQNQGAPFFAHVPGPNMFTGGPVMFATAMTTDEAQNMVHYARVVTSLDNIGSISIDGYFPNGLLFTRMGASQYYYFDATITSGNHRVQAKSAGVTFAVTVYGYGNLRSYAFNPALNLPTTGTC